MIKIGTYKIKELFIIIDLLKTMLYYKKYLIIWLANEVKTDKPVKIQNRQITIDKRRRRGIAFEEKT